MVTCPRTGKFLLFVLFIFCSCRLNLIHSVEPRAEKLCYKCQQAGHLVSDIGCDRGGINNQKTNDVLCSLVTVPMPLPVMDLLVTLAVSLAICLVTVPKVSPTTVVTTTTVASVPLDLVTTVVKLAI